MDYFTADLHLGHAGVLSERNCNRPFDSLHEMNKTIIDNINQCVKEKDTLYILGDFAYRCSLDKIMSYRKLIKCNNLILIKGNHDQKYLKKEEFVKLFDKIKTRIFYKGMGLELVLDHYALLSWPKAYHGAFHLFGHSHGKLNHPNLKAIDVGVDCWGFKPLSIIQIKDTFNKRLKNITIKNVNFISQFEAEKIIPGDREAIISISEPERDVNLSNLWNKRLDLEFHDIDEKKEGQVIFNKEHYKDIISFLKNIENNTESIIVHCHAGISRSAAVAMFIADIYKLPFNRQYPLYNKYIYNLCKKEYYS